MRYPEGYLWDFPGFYSITVPYGKTNDFFYSGHTGTLTLILLEFISLKQRVLAILVFISWVFMLNMLLITKVHYLVDIVGGLIFSIWYYRLAIRIIVYFDKLLSLPYVLGNWIYRKKCKAE